MILNRAGLGLRLIFAGSWLVFLWLCQDVVARGGPIWALGLPAIFFLLIIYMGTPAAIQVEHLGKLYRLGEVGTGTLSQDLNRAWARLRNREDPYAKSARPTTAARRGRATSYGRCRA